MRVPSLRRRVILLGMGIVVVVVAIVDLGLTLPLTEELERSTERKLDAREALVLELSAVGTVGEELAAALRTNDIPGVVHTADGGRVDVRTGLAGDAGGGPRRVVALPDGSRVELYVSQREGTIVRRILLTGTAAALIAIAASLVLFELLVRRTLRPLDEVVEAAQATARGRTGERLRPDRTDTEIGRLAAAFDEMLETQEASLASARDAEARSRRFLADAAHQLRTPVAGLRAAAEALVTGGTGGDRDRLLVHLAREAARTGRLLDDLLTVAYLDRGRQLDLSPIDLTTLLREEAEVLRHRRTDLDVAVRGDPCDLEVDARALREAVANLLDNAGRHAVSQVDVEVATPPGDVVTARISDDGPGLPAGREEEVFERFVSLDDEGGSGLGLPIARGVARAHGGDVRWVDGAFELSVRRRSAADPTGRA